MSCTCGVEKWRFSGFSIARLNHCCSRTSVRAFIAEIGAALTRLPSLLNRAKLTRLSLLAS